MNEVLASLAEIARRGTTGALCTVLRAKGSTPRKGSFPFPQEITGFDQKHVGEFIYVAKVR